MIKNYKKVKNLSFGLIKTGCVNFNGEKTLKNRSSGKQKRNYRLIDFYRINYEIPAIVLRLEYDPNRTAKIALICYKNGFLSYIIATKGLVENSFLNILFPTVGITNKISFFKTGSFICCLELRSGFGSKLTRSAGTFSIILSKNYKTKTFVRLASGVKIFLQNENKVTLGIVSNITHRFDKMYKAGQNYHKGLKPKVRGVAKNSVDHPHGGGRGKTSPLPTAVNFTRRVLKGVPTVRKK